MKIPLTGSDCMTLKERQEDWKTRIREAAITVFGKGSFTLTNNGLTIEVKSCLGSQLTKLTEILEVKFKVEDITFTPTHDAKRDSDFIELAFSPVLAPKVTEVLFCFNGQNNLASAQSLQYKFYEMPSGEIYLTQTGQFYCQKGDLDQAVPK